MVFGWGTIDGEVASDSRGSKFESNQSIFVQQLSANCIVNTKKKGAGNGTFKLGLSILGF